MDFRLRVFVSVANNRSFTRAAEELHISQPAISKHIHELESQYQVVLFERVSGASVKITPEGEKLLKHAQLILEAFKHMEYDMNQLTKRFAGYLRIGASTTIAQYVLPSMLADFMKKYPDVKLDLLNENSLVIERKLLEKKIDIGLVEGVSRLPNLKYTPFMEDELVLITSSGSKYAEKDEISLDEMKKIPLLLRENGSGTLDVIKEELQKHGLSLSEFNIIMQLGSTESIKMFLDNSDAVGLVSIRSVRGDLYAQRFKVIDVVDVEFKRTFQFVELQGKNGGLEEDFVRFVQTYIYS